MTAAVLISLTKTTTKNNHQRTFFLWLKLGSHCAIFFFKSPLGLYLSDCTNMMIMSHYGISGVINVRLYDNQDELKTGARKKTCPDTSSDCELHCRRDRNVGYHEKYMNGGNTGIFKKNSVCSSTHPHENSGATSVYIEKATYQINSVSGGRAGVYGW